MNYLICVVTYNRINPLCRLLKSLIESNYLNHKYDLLISIDHSNSENKIVESCKKIQWTHGSFRILTYNENMGLRNHMLRCISYVKDYDGIFLFEDDLVVSKNFPLLIEQTVSLNDYSCIAGTAFYSYGINEFVKFSPFKPIKGGYDVYLMKIPCSWGEFWTRKQGLDFLSWLKENDGKYNFDSLPCQARMWGEKSWKKLFFSYLIEKDQYIIYPYYGFCTNMNEAGTHSGGFSNVMQSYLIENVENLYIPDQINQLVKYDHYMESESLKGIFKDTTIDISGARRLSEVKTRFLLTTQVLNYKYIKSWGLNLVPFEMNILKENDGNEIFLYDLKKKMKNKQKKLNLFMSYIPYGRQNWCDHLKYLFINVKRSIKRKVQKIFRY